MLLFTYTFNKALLEVFIIFAKIKKHPLILGTVLLTGAGIISRILGFFYRIFLSRTIGASGLGLYQLIFPIFTLCLAVSASGIQTAISRFVAEKEHNKKYFYTGLLLSTSLALIFSIGMYFLSPWIATSILKEPRTEELLQLMVFSLVPACIHSCFNGYYYGKKKTILPSTCQITEQLVRVFGTLLIYQILSSQNLPLEPIHAVWGLVISEIAGLLVIVTGYLGCEHESNAPCLIDMGSLSGLFAMALPLTLNHVLMTLSHSIEHLLIPQKLMTFGYTSEEALGHFGIMSGMAMSIIFFPAVITNSLSVLLLPRISEAKASGDSHLVLDTIKGALCCGLALGSLCTFVFLFSSEWIGTYIFDNVLAGFYVQVLSILCPFMYTSHLLNSIVNGLGYAGLTLACNLSGCAIRILAIWIYMPIYGMYAYIVALILSHVIVVLELLVIISLKYQRMKKTN